MRRSMSGALALLAALGSFAPIRGADALKPSNGGPREKGSIVDGLEGGLTINDRAHTEIQGGSLFSALFPVIPVGNFEASSGEAIAFAGRRPPVLVPAAWTAGADTIPFTFEDEYRIAVQVWIVHGPFAEVEQAALGAAVETSQIWSSERQGVAFETFDITDATGYPGAPGVLEFDCSKDVKTLIGFVPGRLNVYYVTGVDISNQQGPLATNGLWCGDGVIGMGHATSGNLLAHEIGHAFFLKHINNAPASAGFDAKNVMWPSSNDRRYLTEGQTFRAVFDHHSALNGDPFYGIYDVRPGAPMRSCAPTNTDTDQPLCPPVQKRIWADGVWPPN